MKSISRKISKVIILILIFEFLICDNISFGAAIFQLAPTMLQVKAIDDEQPAIGYNEYDRNYVDLNWQVSFQSMAEEKYLNFYVKEAAKPYRTATPKEIKDKDVNGNLENFRMKNLKSGTMYSIDMTAYFTYSVDGTSFTCQESLPSNSVKVLTNITLSASAYGANQIKIEWDDVWDENRRIDYKLYISESNSFTNTAPIYINQSQIGTGKPVVVNEGTGKLEYVYTVRDPGRVYYIKIAPDIYNAEIKYNNESEVVVVSSYILVDTKKVASTESGTVWKLQWTSVVTGLNDNTIKTSYQIYKGIYGSSELPQYMAAVDTTNFFVTLSNDNKQYYFIIMAIVKRGDVDVYPGIKIQSAQVLVAEGELPISPSAPEFVDKFERVEGDAIISYENELNTNSATLLWRLPKKGNGEVDTDIYYDIWVINDADLIVKLPDTNKIASAVKMGPSNYVMNESILVGYKYKISDLTANSTYYIKIVAKKTYLEYIDATMKSVEYSSEQSLKVVITKPNGFIDEPITPAKPPLKIKKDSEGNEKITANSAVIQLKNLWYEKFNGVLNKWEYIRTELNSINDTPDLVPTSSIIDDVYYRKVSYDSSITVSVGCIEYTDGIEYNDLLELSANKVSNFPITANDATEDASFNPDGLKHNVDITLGDLKANTRYIIWVRTCRITSNLMSQPSDPIIINTLPAEAITSEKPIVPTFNYNLPSDIYINLAWESREGYKYYVKYNTEDKLETAIGSKEFTAQELVYYGFVTMDGLKKDTIYYFWIQAESTSESGESAKSEWGDSYSVKTLSEIPPNMPKGFGVKSGDDSITNNSITFEWIKENGMEYILEISENLDYKPSKEYQAGNVQEYTVTSLKGNKRYFAKLYAYDPIREIRSTATQSVYTKTNKSTDEYDSDQSYDEIISTEFIEKDKVLTKNIWNIKLLGKNSDRFIEYMRNDNVIDYKLDLTTPPSKPEKIDIFVSDKVIKSLCALNENLVFVTSKEEYVIRPNMVKIEVLNKEDSNMAVKFSIKSSNKLPIKDKNLSVKSDTFKLEVGIVDGNITSQIDSFNYPLKVIYNLNENLQYNQDKSYAYVYDTKSLSWQKLSANYIFDKFKNTKKVSFETQISGEMIFAEEGNNYFDDVAYNQYESSINNIKNIYNIKSVDGRLFEPGNYITIGDAVKIVFDLLNYDYNDNFMLNAYNAGLVETSDINKSKDYLNYKKAKDIVTTYYELKTGKEFENSYKRENFIIENNIKLDDDNNIALLDDVKITRGEMMFLLERILISLGEIE